MVDKSKISFKNPAKNAVVIFDDNGSDIIKIAVLKNIESTIIYTRKEKYYVTIILFLFLVKNVFYFLIKPSKLTLPETKEVGLAANFYKIYLFSCIDYVSPEVILTFTDNSGLFHWLSRTYKKCAFYAIQNGMRNDAKRLYYKTLDDLTAINNSKAVHFSTNVTSMPNLFSFGKHEIDLYKQHKQKVDKIYPVGPVKGSYYKSCVAKDDVEIKFDICLVSDQLLSFPEDHVLSGFELGVGILHDFVQQYIVDTKASICIAMRSADRKSQQIETDYFIKLFGNDVELFERYNATWSTYRAMEKSSIVVALNSTCAFEAFGWGKKVLFCNLSGENFYQAPLPDICMMNSPDYEIFRKKLNDISQIDEVDYKESTKIHAQYLAKYDLENPPHKVIRKKVLEHC